MFIAKVPQSLINMGCREVKAVIRYKSKVETLNLLDNILQKHGDITQTPPTFREFESNLLKLLVLARSRARRARIPIGLRIFLC